MSDQSYDYVIVGSGIGGLFTGALLAARGERVLVLERHYAPGGYGHSFTLGGYTFCAQLHYLWNCGLDEDFGILLRRLGLEDEIRFAPLDPGGFDRLRFPSFSYDIVKGFDRNLERLAARFPDHRNGLRKYFDIVTRLNAEALRMPVGFGLREFLRRPFSFPNILRYRNWTTEDLFERLRFPTALRSILAGQSGDLLLPPSRASLLVHSALVCGYDAGACVPEKSYEHLFGTIVDFINRQPGSQVLLRSWVDRLIVEGDRVVAARTRKGTVYEGKRFLYNGDPRMLEHLVDRPLPKKFRRRLDYEYSPSCMTLYLGLRDLDLADYGFGNWNVWHFADDDVNRCFEEPLERGWVDNATLFMSTPSLHHKQAEITPLGCQQLVVCAPCTYEHFDRLRRGNRQAYRAEKERVTDVILNIIERNYVPPLRRHLDFVSPGTPATNERFVLAPRGNAYGANLTPAQMNIGKIDHRSPFPNLWLTGATAGVPSFAGGVHYTMLLYERLTGDRLLGQKSAPQRKIVAEQLQTAHALASAADEI